MWAELQDALRRFPDAVLTGLDGHGRPVSVRVRVHPDPAVQQVRIPATPGLELCDGPASLLCHSHDARLWTLRSFLARGSLTTDGACRLFVPTTFTPGTGMSGPVGDLRSFIAARRRAGRYLARSGLDRPSVPWTRIRQRP